MSILLDALKKSEEQRQLGTAPDIHGAPDHKPGDAGGGAPKWLPAALLAMAAVAITWVVWVQYRPPEQQAVSGSPVVEQRTDAATEAGVAESAAAEIPRTPVETLPGTADASRSGGQTEAGDSAGRRQVAQTFNQFRSPQPAAAADEQGSPTTDMSGTSAQEPGPASPVPPRAERASTSPQPHVSEPVSYWELPQNVRDNMPEFRITVMVYAEEPGDRFVLMNGQRLVEKESIDGVELEEIRRNGAVFRYRNYRFLVKG